jgi:hypothetical protein
MRFADGTLVGFHKGSLISIGEHSFGFPGTSSGRQSPMGVSPYLAVPHAVVLHNDECLRRARFRSPYTVLAVLDVFVDQR